MEKEVHCARLKNPKFETKEIMYPFKPSLIPGAQLFLSGVSDFFILFGTYKWKKNIAFVKNTKNNQKINKIIPCTTQTLQKY